MSATEPISIKSSNANRLATIRRLYFYLIAFISLVIGLVAFHNLLRTLFDVWFADASISTANNAGFIRNAVARNGGLLLVATPLFLIHWAYIQSIARKSGWESVEECRSALRKFFLYVTLGVLLGIVAVRTATMLIESITLLLGGVPSTQLLWPGEWLALLSSTFFHLAFLAYFAHQLVQDGDLGHEDSWAGTWRRLFQTIVGLVGLWLLLAGAIRILEIALRLILDNFIEAAILQTANAWWLQGVSNGVASLLIGLLLWWLNWQHWDALLNANPEEARTALRRFYLYAATVVSAALALVPAAGLLHRLLLQIFGVAVPADLPELASPLSMLPVGIIAWLWHRQQVKSEAGRYGDTPESATVRRLYYYLVAAVGLVLFWIGLVDILRALLDWLFIGADELSARFRAEQLANGISLIVVGAPVWALHWRSVQRSVQDTGSAAQTERASGPRRAYLYGVALVGALLILFELATVIYRLLLLLLGEPNVDFFGADTLDSLVRSGTAAVFWIVHVLAIRQDTQLTEATIGEMPAPVSIDARRADLEARIQRLESELVEARAELEGLSESS